LAERKRITLVGSESLLGREIRDLAATAGLDLSLRLVATEEADAGTLARVGDEPAIVEPLTAQSIEGADAVILAGPPESSSKALDLAAGLPIIDATGAAEERHDARVRAPLVEEEEPGEEQPARVHVVAHPAAVALALLVRRLHAGDPLRRVVVQVFAPASERGPAGIEELQQQTVALLSFKSLPKAVFDTQAAFNLVAGYGEEAPATLEDTELRIERHLATLLALPGEGEGAPMPSIRVVQAPVFHGYTLSLWVEFESNPGVDALEQTLGAASIDVRGRDLEPPNIVGQAGQGGISVGAIQADRNDPEACWIWAVADNIRLQAENVLALAARVV
jgi:aspartate-semialdehyde dehydrogenase